MQTTRDPQRDARKPTTSHDQLVGRLGEDLADAHLRRLGWQIVERNWRCGDGEIDIVAREPLPDGRSALVFVEVKYRSSASHGDPLEAITPAKVRRLSGLSLLWLRHHAERAEEIRDDAIGVLRRPGQPHTITHVRGITR